MAPKASSKSSFQLLFLTILISGAIVFNFILEECSMLWSFVHRVFSDDLNPEKRWYAVNSYLVDGKEINKLKSSLLFTEFPEELRKVDRLRLKDSNGGLAPKAWFSKSKGNDVFVASSGGLFCYLL